MVLHSVCSAISVVFSSAAETVCTAIVLLVDCVALPPQTVGQSNPLQRPTIVLRQHVFHDAIIADERWL